MELGDLDRRGGEWLRGGGARADIVLSSRVRLARNLAGFPFAQRANDEQKAEIVARAKAPLERAPPATRPVWVDIDKRREARDALPRSSGT